MLQVKRKKQNKAKRITNPVKTNDISVSGHLAAVSKLAHRSHHLPSAQLSRRYVQHDVIHPQHPTSPYPTARVPPHLVSAPTGLQCLPGANRESMLPVFLSLKCQGGVAGGGPEGVRGRGIQPERRAKNEIKTKPDQSQ